MPLILLPLLSSAFTPIQSMPGWFQPIAEYQPFTPAIGPAARQRHRLRRVARVRGSHSARRPLADRTLQRRPEVTAATPRAPPAIRPGCPSSPQTVRRTVEYGRRGPTLAIGETPGQRPNGGSAAGQRLAGLVHHQLRRHAGPLEDRRLTCDGAGSGRAARVQDHGSWHVHGSIMGARVEPERRIPPCPQATKCQYLGNGHTKEPLEGQSAQQRPLRCVISARSRARPAILNCLWETDCCARACPDDPAVPSERHHDWDH